MANILELIYKLQHISAINGHTHLKMCLQKSKVHVYLVVDKCTCTDTHPHAHTLYTKEVGMMRDGQDEGAERDAAGVEVRFLLADGRTGREIAQQVAE